MDRSDEGKSKSPVAECFVSLSTEFQFSPFLKPHHASRHVKLDWKDFVTKPWTMERVGKDLEVTEEQKKNSTFCQQDFLYKDINSCFLRPYPPGYFQKTIMSNHQPFYEMRHDGSGEPYDNILEMRAAKNRNFLSTKEFEGVEELWVVHYEDLLRGGTAELIRRVEEMTGAKAACDVYPSNNKEGRIINAEEQKYLDKHIDWEAEELIGYTRKGMKSLANKSTIYRRITSSS